MPATPSTAPVAEEEAVLEAEHIAREAADLRLQRMRRQAPVAAGSEAQPAPPIDASPEDAVQRLAVGQRNRGRVIDVGAGVKKPELPKNLIDRGELLVKNAIKDSGQRMRLLSTENQAFITPPPAGSDVYVSGGIEVKQGQPGVPSMMWNSRLGRLGRSLGTTTLQTFLGSIYTMVGWAHEILYHYLKKGWYDFAFKTLFLKEFLGGILRLPKRLIMGPERRTDETIAAENAVKEYRKNSKTFVDAATARRTVINEPLRPNVRADFDRTLKNLNAHAYMHEAAPEVPRRPEVPTNAEVDARRQTAAGAGDAVPVSRGDHEHAAAVQSWSDHGRKRRYARRNSGRQL
jgi:hypothetical protein